MLPVGRPNWTAASFCVRDAVVVVVVASAVTASSATMATLVASAVVSRLALCATV
ncbi:hypothetical protein [Pseudolactococcus insecticola]|uniref:hypothetical protein n=1 Tax=Pseudolactococcus insecticola TaxID=2709158 RepID=UPI0015546CED|nr:hypothetical protein [Lactococcus insecticola]